MSVNQAGNWGKAMSMTDPIADMLTRIRNAHMALHKTVVVPSSKIKKSILQILQEEGYIQKFEENEKNITVFLKYVDGKCAIAGLKKISKPSRRTYTSSSDIPLVQNGLGINILSTSKGIMQGSAARFSGVGGELICEIW